jgi:diaminohydroxyphosphoribosylaminopyrimidine deaminase/5-amino-6-(5-phosphoribosylamino)uracil reductase
MPFSPAAAPEDLSWMDVALRLARRGYGRTSPNPMVGAVLVRNGRFLGGGWHQQAGGAHAEVAALRECRARGENPKGATLYVTLEPCSTTGRTPPCTDAILASGISRVVVGATDPNPKHAGRGYEILRSAGLQVVAGVRSAELARLNEAFNHWIICGKPFVTVKAAMSADGKIATASGQSRWISGPRARAFGMRLRRGADAILTGINTVLADDPRLTVRRANVDTGRRLRRVVLDAGARTPLPSHVVSDAHPDWTTIVVSESADAERVARLADHVSVLVAPATRGSIDLVWTLEKLGNQGVTHLLVEGGGEVNASFLGAGLAQRIAFIIAPKILGGRTAVTAVEGEGVPSLSDAVTLRDVEWRPLGADFLLTARVRSPQGSTIEF